MRPARHQQGDTIIEVMFAFAVFALVAITSVSIMNSGVATSQRSLEITLVRGQMDAQVSALRYIHQQYVIGQDVSAIAQWKIMTKDKQQASASPFGLPAGAIACPAVKSTGGFHSFVLNARRALVWPTVPRAEAADGTLPPFAQVVYNNDSSINDAYGIWIEAVPTKANGGIAGFVDFHVRACWPASGQAVPMMLGTIVRLYEPAD